jgi:hypothetical protein
MLVLLHEHADDGEPFNPRFFTGNRPRATTQYDSESEAQDTGDSPAGIDTTFKLGQTTRRRRRDLPGRTIIQVP